MSSSPSRRLSRRSSGKQKAAPPPEPEDGPSGPTEEEQRKHAGETADLLLELDDERDNVNALYAAAHRALADWAAEFVAVMRRDPTREEVRESPAWPFVKKKTTEAEVRRLALNETLLTMGEEPVPQPNAAASFEGQSASQKKAAFGTFSSERARLTLIRALEPRVLQPPDATAELRSYFCTVALAAESAHGGEDGFSGTSDEELEQAALLFAHFDADSDGLLSRDEFIALLGLVSAKAGTNYEHEHLVGMFADADIDRNGVLDLNELLVLLRGPKPVPGFGGGGGGARSSGGGKGSAELRDARRGR